MAKQQQQQHVRIALTIPLRDFAAFEDLTTELEVTLEVVEFLASAPTSNGTGSRRHTVTEKVVAKVKAYAEAHPKATLDRIKTGLKIPHSRATVSRILQGYYD